MRQSGAPTQDRDLDHLLTLAARPEAWIALAALIAMEVVLGIDNLLFISILTNKLPEEHRAKTRTIGISLALIMRLALLSSIAWLAQLREPVVNAFGHDFSWRDIILGLGGLFLLYKATSEIRENVDPRPHAHRKGVVAMSFVSAIFQIILLDMVFSIDSILTAIGMTDELPIMVIAVLVAVAVMLFASGPVATFINRNPTVVMLALGFLLMIGMTLIADAFGFHVPKGYIYVAMAFSCGIEALNMLSRNAHDRRVARENEDTPQE
jgi:predicted tellurium resistance membrane protein TerC